MVGDHRSRTGDLLVTQLPITAIAKYVPVIEELSVAAVVTRVKLKAGLLGQQIKFKAILIARQAAEWPEEILNRQSQQMIVCVDPRHYAMRRIGCRVRSGPVNLLTDFLAKPVRHPVP